VAIAANSISTSSSEPMALYSASKPESLPPSLPRRPKPPSTQDTAFFWEQATLHKLAIQRCCACGRLRHPPMPICPRCHGFTWDFVESKCQGTLFSWTTVHAPLAEPFDQPYSVGIVELDEGTRLVAMLQDGETAWRIGMRVKVGFVDCEGGFALPLIQGEDA
jgi:uncharacterized protein